MTELRLRAVSRTSGANALVKDQTVAPEGITLDFEEVPVLVHAFRRMVRELAYDVCEMAITTYLCAREHGKAITALPIFLVRGLHHGAVVHNTRSAVRAPKGLEGRRVGVHRGYTVTTGVWARAILQTEHGVDLDRVTWVRSGDEHVAEYRPPPNVVALEPGKDLVEMLTAGQLDAAVNVDVEHADVAPLIPDPAGAGLAALIERGFYPINHLVVVRDDLLRSHPFLAVALFEAFAAAKSRYVDDLLADRVQRPSPADRMYRTIADATGEDPLPYGIGANRSMLETLVRHAVDQGILAHPVAPESMFAPGTHDLTA